MSTEKKPRADSVLKTLPPERQAAIVEHLREHSLKDTRQWLAADGLKTSEAALSGFLSWYALQRQLNQNAATVEALLADFKSANPAATPDQVQQVGQAFFTSLALQQQDPKQWFMIQQTAIKKEQLSLDRSKFQRETCELFVKWTADQRASAIAASTASNADKIEQLGELMFGEDWK